MQDVLARSGARLAGIFLATALAAAPSPAPVAAQETGTSRIQGRVTEAGTGAPLAGVTVRVLGTDRSVLTSDDGLFRITRLQPGTRSLSFEALGYRPRVVEVQLTADAAALLDVSLTTAPLAVAGLVVTSQKRQQAVQEVPITITVFEGDFLESTGIQEFDNLSAYTPGLEVQLQSPNNPGFVVRGITSDDGDSRIEPRVSVFQDGVSISKARGSVVELFDLERVEVLKGPQGTLFGRAAEIGAVHLIQNKARNETSGQVTAGPGNHGALFASGYANAPILEDRLFGRIAGVYNHRDGYVENLGGGDLNGKETVALRGLLRYAPNEFTDVDLILNWQRDTPPGTAFQSGVFSPTADGAIDPFSPPALGGDGRFEDLFVDRTVWGATLLADRVLSPAWTLQAVGAYRTFDSYESFDADGTRAPILQLAEDAEGEQYSLELRALFNNGGRLSGFGGVNVFHEDGSQGVIVRTDERSLFPLLTRIFHVQSGGAFPQFDALTRGEPNVWNTLPSVITFLGPALYPQNPTFFDTLVGAPLSPYHEERLTNYGRTTAYDAFFDGTYEVTDRLDLTGGLRATFDDMWAGLQVPPSEEPSLIGTFSGAYPNAIFSPTPEGRTISREESFTSLVGRLAAGYELSPALNLFGTVARGRRPHVMQETGGNPTREFQVLAEEVVWNYEAGVKGTLLEQRVRYDVAGFYYDYQDFQTDVQEEITPSGVVFRTDLGEATAFGTEIDFAGRVSEALTLFGNYAFIDASFDELNREGDTLRLAGNTFRLTPKHSFSAGFGLTREVAGATLFLRPSYSWKSRVYFEEQYQGEDFRAPQLDRPLAAGLYQDPYGLLNLRAGADLLAGRASLELWANNLLDEEYILDAGNTGLAFYAPTFIPGPPLLFGARLTARF